MVTIDLTRGTGTAMVSDMGELPVMQFVDLRGDTLVQTWFTNSPEEEEEARRQQHAIQRQLIPSNSACRIRVVIAPAPGNGAPRLYEFTLNTLSQQKMSNGAVAYCALLTDGQAIAT